MRIEESFRALKGDLGLRPVFHQLDERNLNDLDNKNTLTAKVGIASRTVSTAVIFSLPRRGGLDMHRSWPLGRFGGIVAVDADRLLRGFLVPHPPERTVANQCVTIVMCKQICPESDND